MKLLAGLVASFLAIGNVAIASPTPTQGTEDMQKREFAPGLAMITHYLARYPNTPTDLQCDIPVEVDENASAWSCFTNVVYVMSFTLSGYFRSLPDPNSARRSITARADDIHNKHSHQLAADGNATILSQLQARYIGDEPILALSCDTSGEKGCYDIFYSNELHKDGKRTVHRLDAQPGSNTKVFKRQLNTQHAQSKATNGHDIYGAYVFMDQDTTSETSWGWDGDFPATMAWLAAGFGNSFGSPGIGCMDLFKLNAESDGKSEVGTIGWVGVSSDPIDTSNQQYVDSLPGWMDACEAYAYY